MKRDKGFGKMKKKLTLEGTEREQEAPKRMFHEDDGRWKSKNDLLCPLSSVEEYSGKVHIEFKNSSKVCEQMVFHCAMYLIFFVIVLLATCNWNCKQN